MTDSLYIIGNGFDLHHGLKTSYADFRENYAKKRSRLWSLLYDIYGDSINEEMWWSDFEDMLAHIDYAHLTKTPNGIPLGFMKTRNLLRGVLPPLFGNWIKKIDCNVKPDKSLSINTDSHFFSFNYTMLLEKVYGIGHENVWHIHNSIRNPDDIVVGHDSDNRDLFLRWIHYMNNHPDISSRKGIIDMVNQEVVNGAKKVKERIAQNADRFYELYSSIKHFVVMGFSFNDIDMPYIEEIANANPRIDEADWTIYFHLNGENEMIMGKLVNIGIKEGNINEAIKW